VEIINTHPDPSGEKTPLFVYLPWQAVHSPYSPVPDWPCSKGCDCTATPMLSCCKAAGAAGAGAGAAATSSTALPNAQGKCGPWPPYPGAPLPLLLLLCCAAADIDTFRSLRWDDPSGGHTDRPNPHHARNAQDVGQLPDGT